MIKNRLTSVRSPRKAIYQFFAFLLLMLFLFYPFDFIISPERIFKLVDENKKPIPRANIKQVWYQYSLHYSHEESIEPGTDGIVVLPRRTIRTRWIDLLIGAVTKRLQRIKLMRV